MTEQQITEIMNQLDFDKGSLHVGALRVTLLPKKIKYGKEEELRVFLNGLTDLEFENWMREQ